MKRSLSKKTLIFWVILFLSSVSLAQTQREGLEISGSLGNEIVYACKSWSDCRKSDSFLNPDGIFDSEVREIEDSLRLNLRADAQVAENASVLIRAEYSFVPTDPANTNQIILDEAFLDVELGDYFFLKTGKQRITWGTGFAWNPTDVINPRKNPLDPKRQKEGIASLKAVGAIDFLSITGVVVPDIPIPDPFTGETRSPDAGNTALAGRVDAFLFDFDWSLSSRAVKDKKPIFGADFSGILFDEVEFHGEVSARGGSEKFYIKGGKLEARADFKPDDLFQPAQTKINKEEIFPKFVIGGNYTAPTDTFILIDYYYNGEGYTKDEFNKYIAYLRYYADEYEKDQNIISGFLPGISFPKKDEMLRFGAGLFTPGGLRHNYLFLNITHPIEETVIVGGRALWGIDDLIDRGRLSAMFSPSIDYVEINNVTFSLGSNFFIGDKETEFGMIPIVFNITAGLTMFF